MTVTVKCRYYHIVYVIVADLILRRYHTWKILVGDILANLANCKLFTKVFFASIHR